MRTGIEALALLVIGGLFGNELAIASFVHPALTRLDDATHARAAQALARVLGAAMPFWYALALILALAAAWLVYAPGSFPANWREQRRRWDRMHQAGVALLGAAALSISFANAVGD